MKKHIAMPSIEQFRNVIKNITHVCRYEDMDGEKVIYNNDPLPTLKAFGTTKLHGTNASVCYNPDNNIWAQSKKNIITPEKDNAGFAFFVDQNYEIFLKLFTAIVLEYAITQKDNNITIYGEWAGKGIQKDVGISQIDKKFYIFGIKISPHDTEKHAYWLESNIFNLNDYENIYHVKDFKTFEIEIDFKVPGLSNNKMVNMVTEVENECPVAKHFGISGIGEGIVFETKYKNKTFKWKMKGKKHAGKSKVKTPKKVDNKKIQLINDVVESITPEWRLSQMYNETFDILNGGTGDIKKTGDFLRAVINDIIKEESDIIAEAGLIPKDINKFVSIVAREWFMDKLNEESGL